MDACMALSLETFSWCLSGEGPPAGLFPMLDSTSLTGYPNLVVDSMVFSWSAPPWPHSPTITDYYWHFCKYDCTVFTNGECTDGTASECEDGFVGSAATTLDIYAEYNHLHNLTQKTYYRMRVQAQNDAEDNDGVLQGTGRSAFSTVNTIFNTHGAPEQVENVQQGG